MKRLVVMVLSLLLLLSCGGNAIQTADATSLPSSPFDELTKSVIFELDAYRIPSDASAEQVVSLYRNALADGRQNGFTPVLVFVDDLLRDYIDGVFSEGGGRDAYIASMLSSVLPDGKDVLNHRLNELEQVYESYMPSIHREELERIIPEYPHSDTDLCLFETEQVEPYLVCVPTDKPYEVFAYLPFGGWNACPEVSEMITIARYWYEQYGVVPAAISHDTLQFYNEKPIDDLEAASKLASEQFAFCDGVLESGGIELYGAMSYGGSWWFFWWD